MGVEVVVSGPGRHGHIDLQERLAGWVRFVDVSYAHLPNPVLRPLILGLEGSVSQERLARPVSCVSGLPARGLAGKQPSERAVGCCAEVVPNPHGERSLRAASVKMLRAFREQIHTTDGRVSWNVAGDDRTHRKERLALAVQCVNEIPKSLVHFVRRTVAVSSGRASKARARSDWTAGFGFVLT